MLLYLFHRLEMMQQLRQESILGRIQQGIRVCLNVWQNKDAFSKVE